MAVIIPIYRSLVLPDSRMNLQNEIYRKAAGRDPETGERAIFVMAKKEKEPGEYTSDDFWPIGVSGTVRDVSSSGFAMFNMESRVDVESMRMGPDGVLEANTVIRRPDVDDLPFEEEKKKLDGLKGAILKMTESYQWGTMARGWIMQWRSVSEVMTVISQWLNLTSREKYSILEEDSKRRRVEMMEKILYEYIEITTLTNEANTEQEETTHKLYREQAIKKQLEYLQKQLDEMHPENVSDVRRLEKKVQDSGMNETARKEAEKVLGRMRQEGQNSPEYGNLYNYLDFLTSLNWKKARMPKIDIDRAAQILDEDHYGLKKVKDRILQQIAVMDLNRKQSGSILLFVGAPGTGKTSIGRSVARALKRKYVRVSLGGVRDEADIRGHRRTYIGAMPGRIMDGIQKSGASNPVVVLDEVDKLGMSYNGDPASALLEVLDPEQNNTFTDHYMNVPYDLSDVLFICTANTTDSIPEPLLNRMEIIEFSGYTASEKYQIALKHLLPKAQKAMGIPKDRLVITDEAVREIISGYTMEGGVRGLKKRFDTLCRAAAVEFARGRKEPLVIGPEDLEKYLDMKPLRHEHVLAEKKPGIVTGLAWTQSGGEILFIETLFTKGNGKITVTGQLGDVMKESVQIAVSLVKNMFPEKVKLFEENDLHIHVPAGAVPKDGPSAGITITTALASLVTGKAVSPEFAMTGEVSLRGVVMPIGGLPEKLMAAVRSGVKTVFIPKENEKDLKDVADEVKAQLNIIPVTEVQEVLKKTKVVGYRRKFE